MKDIGDKISREHHLDTLGLEITEAKEGSIARYAAWDQNSLCCLAGVSLVAGVSPDICHSQRHGIRGLKHEDEAKTLEPLI